MDLCEKVKFLQSTLKENELFELESLVNSKIKNETSIFESLEIKDYYDIKFQVLPVYDTWLDCKKYYEEDKENPVIFISINEADETESIVLNTKQAKQLVDFVSNKIKFIENY